MMFQNKHTNMKKKLKLKNKSIDLEKTNPKSGVVGLVKQQQLSAMSYSFNRKTATKLCAY